jgi:hypothetical protein
MSSPTLLQLLPRVKTEYDCIVAYFIAATRLPSLQGRWLLADTWVLKIQEHFQFPPSVKLDKATLNRAISKSHVLGGTTLDIYDSVFNTTGIVKAFYQGRVDGDRSQKQTAYRGFLNATKMPKQPDMKLSSWLDEVETGRTLRDRDLKGKISLLAHPGIAALFLPVERPNKRARVNDNR